MKWNIKQVTASIVIAASVVTALTVFAAGTDFSDFELGTATHETRTASQDTPQISNTDETAEDQTDSSTPATRTTLMANWRAVSGASGYLLDVSTDDSFSDYVDGYHDLDVGQVTRRVVTGLRPATTYYYRVRAYGDAVSASYSQVTAESTKATTGLTIHPTFDSSITGNPSAEAIEAMINRAISIYESMFSDPITIQILFRYARAAPDGTAFPHGPFPKSHGPLHGSLEYFHQCSEIGCRD